MSNSDHASQPHPQSERADQHQIAMPPQQPAPHAGHLQRNNEDSCLTQLWCFFRGALGVGFFRSGERGERPFNGIPYGFFSRGSSQGVEGAGMFTGLFVYVITALVVIPNIIKMHEESYQLPIVYSP